MKKGKTRALVTGGEGFIGSHLVDLLIEKGFKVFSVDNSPFKDIFPERRNPKAEYIVSDIRRHEETVEHFKRIKPLYVFHTAALARIQPSLEKPYVYMGVNSFGTLIVLDAARKSKAKRVVYSASSSAYGNQKIPLREGMAPDPLNPYASTKLDGERWMKIFALHYGIETVSLRYFNVYGPGNLFSGSYTTVITKFLHLSSRGEPMTIVGDGKQTRDYTHVYDVARGNLLAALSENVGNGEVINLGAGESHSVNEIAEMVGNKSVKKLEKEGKVKFISKRPGEARDTLADNRLARKILGWKPEIKFKDGIEELKKLYGIS